MILQKAKFSHYADSIAYFLSLGKAGEMGDMTGWTDIFCRESFLLYYIWLVDYDTGGIGSKNRSDGKGEMVGFFSQWLRPVCCLPAKQFGFA